VRAERLQRTDPAAQVEREENQKPIESRETIQKPDDAVVDPQEILDSSEADELQTKPEVLVAGSGPLVKDKNSYIGLTLSGWYRAGDKSKVRHTGNISGLFTLAPRDCAGRGLSLIQSPLSEMNSKLVGEIATPSKPRTYRSLSNLHRQHHKLSGTLNSILHRAYTCSSHVVCNAAT